MTSHAAALAWTPGPDCYRSRLGRLADAVGAADLDAAVLSPGDDLQYYVGRGQGSHERLTAVVVRPSADPLLIVPALEWPGWAGTAADGAGFEVVTWLDGEDPYRTLADRLPRDPRLALDDNLPARHVIALSEAAHPADLLLTSPLTASSRQCKDADEAAAMAAVAAANDRVHERIREWLHPGRTEAEVASDIADALVDEGHARADFVIVGSGPNGASPHHSASDRIIEAGDPVVIDIGGPAASGYNSDSTRTYCVGAPTDPEFERVFDIVLRAQEAGVQAAVAGATCASVDAAARAIISEAGYGDYFVTRTGHGIGLAVHEHPYLVAGNEALLRPGMVFSVEPGIYLPGRFGVRIEDIVIVDADGSPRRLNNSPRSWRLDG